MIGKAVDSIREKTQIVPEAGLILGSGLDGLVNLVEDRVEIPYKDIPGFAVSTAEGHVGSLVFGRLEGRNVVIMRGRVHFYEGYDMRNLIFPVQVMKALGIKYLIVTNASGAVSSGHYLGEIVLIKDHVNMLGRNPLMGPNDESIGPRFFDMSTAYTPELRSLALKEAEKLKLPLKEGVYAAMIGPSYETPAERTLLRAGGVDVVGMSTVPEVIAAVHCGLKVIGFSCVTDVPADIPAEEGTAEAKAATHEDVLQAADKAQESLGRLIREIVKNYQP
ncbi:purine-nucleoside phosphorylase [bacterium]|nr:purine-nucleoside phosphorylase [bacterium]